MDGPEPLPGVVLDRAEAIVAGPDRLGTTVRVTESANVLCLVVRDDRAGGSACTDAANMTTAVDLTSVTPDAQTRYLTGFVAPSGRICHRTVTRGTNRG